MSNPFQQAGASQRESKYAPLYIMEFWTGLYSNRNPLREGAVPYLYQKFYSGSRYESILSGQNVEITPRLTIARRPGTSVYNSATFPAPQTFYSFRVFNPYTLSEQIRVIVDTASAVYDCTGPSTNLLLYTKNPGGGQTSFQSVGNTLYAGDGVSVWKWVWAPAWTANSSFTTGNIILDPTNALQAVTAIVGGPEINVGPTTPSVTIAGNVCTLNWNNAQWGGTQLTALPATTALLASFVGASFLNGQTVTVSTVVNISYFSPPFGAIHQAVMTFTFAHGDYATTADSGVVEVISGTATSGGSIPTFSTTIGGTTTDGSLIWTNKGPAVQNWGIIAPTLQPVVSNVVLPSTTAWAASTYYWPGGNAFIVDSNSNIQKLTTVGTTGSGVPVWSSTPGVTTPDNTGGGTAVWTCVGSATRVISTPYAVGAYIAVTVTTTVQGKTTYVKGNPNYPVTQETTFINKYLYICSVAGTSGTTTTANLSWPSTLGGNITDGTVTWTNAGYEITRTASSTVSPTSNTVGNVSNSTIVTNIGSIVDNGGSGGGTGFTQNVTVAGISGASAPTWKTAGSVEQAGLITTEAGGLQWTNGGPVAVANTGTWIYAYSYGNSVTGHESSASPLSTAITLALSSAISISGQGDPNFRTDGVDTIHIYRSTQGFVTPFLLTSIPAPFGGAPWSYVDTSPDPPNPTAILNEFISADTTGNNAPPPNNMTNLTFYLGRVFGSNGEFQDYSGADDQPVGVGTESFPGLNFFQLPSSITKSWASATGLLIFTLYGVFLSQGLDGNFNPLTPVPLLEDIGLLSPNAFTVNGSIPALFTSDNHLLTLDPSSGVSDISNPIADVLGVLNSQDVYLTWHIHGNDQAFYLADGTSGWWRVCPTSSPESGFTWSPKALIATGIGCVKSIETSPGVKSLLVGLNTTGQIMQRDLTTNSDNGTPYLANFVIGSLVFAQPNQCAEIESITTEALAIGTKPAVGVLGDEISGAFELLTIPENDPPFLNAATSVYANRWYLSQLSQPAWLRHMQIEVSWPAENAANELIAIGIYGCVHPEI